MAQSRFNPFEYSDFSELGMPQLDLSEAITDADDSPKSEDLSSVRISPIALQELKAVANASFWAPPECVEEPGPSSSDGSGTQEEAVAVWERDGHMEVAGQKVRVKEVSDVLESRFAYISGVRTPDGHPILTFPDTRVQVSFDEYHLLIAYLLQVPPLDDATSKGYVLVVDRRTDKWSSVRILFSYLLVIVCQSAAELRQCLGEECLTMDVGGALKYNHLEWVQHRMDIERMKSSAAVIAESLSEFGRCLRETELPNDVETTERVLEAQSAEHDAIKHLPYFL
ncbi:Protein CGEF-1 b [Aphelenchoides avenae]|nr:Protein CGEF-1 b [Aphelenchus avenae]